MSYPFSDYVVLSAVTTAISAGLAAWWWLTRSRYDVRLALEPITQLTKIAPKPANVNYEDAAPDSSVRIRVGARLRAVDSN